MDSYINFSYQTPDGALLDMMRNAYDLLSKCGITIPEVNLRSLSA